MLGGPASCARWPALLLLLLLLLLLQTLHGYEML
jgi:hypothetical protein